MSDENGWIRFDQAVEITGRSSATLNRVIAAGKIHKKLVPASGRRPEVFLSSADLESAFGPVHVPVVIESPEPIRSDQMRSPDRITLAPPIAMQAQEWLEHQKLVAKLTWSMKEAREMTGLSERTLRAMIAQKPDLVVRLGRLRIKAEALRRELG